MEGPTDSTCHLAKDTSSFASAKRATQGTISLLHDISCLRPAYDECFLKSFFCNEITHIIHPFRVYNSVFFIFLGLCYYNDDLIVERFHLH